MLLRVHILTATRLAASVSLTPPVGKEVRLGEPLGREILLSELSVNRSLAADEELKDSFVHQSLPESGEVVGQEYPNGAAAMLLIVEIQTAVRLGAFLVFGTFSSGPR